MRDLSKTLKDREIDFGKLLSYGFDTSYKYETNICDNQFKVVVELKENRKVSWVVDLVSNEEYVLVDVVGVAGNFVGKVREEYENILDDIIQKCSIFSIFKSSQSKQIIEYVKTKYNDDLEYLWKKFPSNAIWRNKINNKWYGLLLTISERKLGIDSDIVVECLNLKCSKEKINKILNNKNIYPGYHMNKDNWITIKLDESMKIEEILKLLDDSYELSLAK